MRQGEVWQVVFDPSRGAEIRKTRPAIVISKDAVGILPLRVVVPLTTWQADFAHFQWMIRLEPSPQNGIAQSSAADTFQVKSLSTQRFLRRLGEITGAELAAIVRGVGVVIGHP